MILNGILWGVSALLTLLTVLCAPLSPWWALLLLPGLYIAAGATYMIFLLIISWFLPKTEGQSHKNWCRVVIVETIKWVLQLMHFRVRLIGENTLPTNKPFLLVCNHRSNFDPLITMAAMHRWPMAFVSKPENFRIILAGNFMRCASFLAIDRENVRNAATTVHRAADYIRERNLVMGIYPEGTRSKTAELLEFRSGALKIAKLAECPVAVMTIQYMPRRHPLAPKEVMLRVVELLDETYVKENRASAISDHARELIAADLQNP